MRTILDRILNAKENHRYLTMDDYGLLIPKGQQRAFC